AEVQVIEDVAEQNQPPKRRRLEQLQRIAGAANLRSKMNIGKDERIVSALHTAILRPIEDVARLISKQFSARNPESQCVARPCRERPCCGDEGGGGRIVGKSGSCDSLMDKFRLARNTLLGLRSCAQS